MKRRSPFISGKAPLKPSLVPRPVGPLPQRLDSRPRSLGAGLASGGALRSGGGLASGGQLSPELLANEQEARGAGLASGGAFPSGLISSERVQSALSTVKDQYHGLMRMKQHDWEAVRETASQALGNAPSLMWGAIPIGKFKGDEHHMRTLAKAHSPHIAAKLLESEHVHQGEGGGLSTAFSHVIGGLRQHTGSIIQGVQGVASQAAAQAATQVASRVKGAATAQLGRARDRVQSILTGQ